ncbi:DUF3024 domain-containing protein [Pelotalea chapellei]|uniref:DUF3024 domain-containing protein n=1 Tax=Pelotalea chapellei TaxID=44671 RepID=A0ABS5U5V6_9BACT|nr:DUF3024 domain-containing protein [Pelotalea chapellei]MBT1071046.1 DUF3024 domain-containing protein [Pelotalea chapellei]
MALPDNERESVNTLLKRLCSHRITLYKGENVELKYAVSGNKVTLVESRPFFVDPGVWNHIKVAQFEFSPTACTWTLYWYDRKNRRQPYPTGRNRDVLEKLVDEVTKDPTGIFWE